MATEVGRIVARYIADTTNFQRGNAMVRSEMQATNRMGKRSGAGMATYGKYLTLGGGAMIFGALKSFAEYQRNLNIFQANTDAGTKTMTRASVVAKKLGADLRFPGVTAGHVAATLVELSKAGLTANQSITALEPVMLLGTAGQMEYAEAGAVAANAMNAFNLKAKQLPTVVNAIAGAALKSSSDVKDVAEAFKYTSSAAAGLGVPVKQVTTLTGLLSNLGLKGDMAGTSMRMFFESIARPRSNPAAEQMRELGLLVGGKKGNRKGKNAFFDKNGNIKDLDEIFRIWTAHTKNLNRQQKGVAENIIFGIRGKNVARSMDRYGEAGYKKMFRESNKAGNAQKLAAANTKGLYGAYQALINTVQTLGLELGEVLAPTVIKVLHHINRFAGVIQKNKTVVRALGLAIIAIAAGYVAWQGILLLWRAAMLVHNTILAVGRGIMIAYRAAVLAIRAPIVLAMAAQWLFNAAISANPLGLIILAIVAVIAILRHYGVSMADVIKFTKRVWAVTKDVFAKIKHTIAVVIAWIKQHWALVIMGMVAAPALAVLLIIKHWHKIVHFLRHKLGPAMWRAAKAAFAWLWTQLKTLGKQFYEIGKDLGKQIGEGIKDGAKAAAGSLFDKWKDVATHPWKATGGYWLLQGGKKVWHQADDMGVKGMGPKAKQPPRMGGPRRAMGGTVWGGTSYMVGERGPEMFTPGAGGHISPNGGGGPSVTIENMHVRSDEDPYIIASVLGRQLRLAQ